MQEGKKFLVVFVVAGFVTKMAAEFIHEVIGHGLLVLLFRGEITSLYISVLWPYDLSRIDLNLPTTLTPAQIAFVYIGGILACLCASFLTQAFLLQRKEVPWRLALTLFWFAFWTFANADGYLLIGGLRPFGDIDQLIKLGALTNVLSFVIGLVFFIMGFVALSWILRKIMVEVFPFQKASLGVLFFWFIIPALVVAMWANPEHDLNVAYVPLAFIPALVSSVIEYSLVLSKQGADANPDDVAED